MFEITHWCVCIYFMYACVFVCMCVCVGGYVLVLMSSFVYIVYLTNVLSFLRVCVVLHVGVCVCVCVCLCVCV